MSDNKVNIGCTGYPSFTGLLTILFTGLKLGGIITWSWWWVLCPLWIPIVVIFIILLIIGLIVFCK